MVFRWIQAIISFLSIIPTTRHSTTIDIYSVAKVMYLFPIAGAIIGTIVGIFAYTISFYIQPLLLGVLVTAVLVIITGVNHTDALADFADGLMAKGGKEGKHKAMRDPAVGSAGTVTVVLYVAGMVVALSSFHFEGLKLLTSIVVAEAIAKYSMVLQAHIGLSAWEGFSSPFTASMKDRRKMLASTAIIILILVLTGGGYAGIVSLSGSVLIGMILHYISKKSFGGISGDVIGASNELTRLSSLIIFSSATNDWSKQVTMIAALMCGGRGTRMGIVPETEKPLLKLKGITMIDRVLHALVGSGQFEKIVAIPSINTPKTNTFMRNHYYSCFRTDRCSRNWRYQLFKRSFGGCLQVQTCKGLRSIGRSSITEFKNCSKHCCQMFA